MGDDPKPASAGRGWADQVHRTLGAAEQLVGALLVAVILTLVVLQAAQRYLPVDGWVWTGELARYGLVWLTFAVAGYLTSTSGHVGIEVVDYVARGRALTVVKRFADAVIAVAAGAFVLDCWDLVTVPTSQISPAAGLSMQLVYLMPLIGFALTALRAAWAAVAGRPAPPATEETIVGLPALPTTERGL